MKLLLPGSVWLDVESLGRVWFWSAGWGGPPAARRLPGGPPAGIIPPAPPGGPPAARLGRPTTMVQRRDDARRARQMSLMIVFEVGSLMMFDSLW